MSTPEYTWHGGDELERRTSRSTSASMKLVRWTCWYVEREHLLGNAVALSCDWLSTHSCMPLQQLPTVTKDANAHARLGYVRSQSLASTTTSPVETRGRPDWANCCQRRHSRTLAKLKVHHQQRSLLTNASSLHPTMPIGAVQMQNGLHHKGRSSELPIDLDETSLLPFAG